MATTGLPRCALSLPPRQPLPVTVSAPAPGLFMSQFSGDGDVGIHSHSEFRSLDPVAPREKPFFLRSLVQELHTPVGGPPLALARTPFLRWAR